MNNKVNILGVKIDKVSIPEAVDMIMDFIENGEKARAVYTPNSEIVMQGYRDDAIREILMMLLF